MTRKNRFQLKSLIMSGARWLQQSQSDEAMLTHLGVGCAVVCAGIRIELTPCGFRDGPVFVFYPSPSCDNGEEPVLWTESQIRTIRGAFHLVARIDDAWNGVGSTSYSVQPRIAVNVALRAAVDRYRAGCPEHPHKSVFCECEWYRNGFAALVHPEGYA
jgi:hypothetical protein